MLTKVGPSLLPRVCTLAAPAVASGRLAPALSRAFAAQGDKESSYERLKEMANKSGDPAKEWMQGAKGQASAMAQSADEMYEATKRGAQEATTKAKEAMGRGMKEAKQQAMGGGGGEGCMQGMAASMSQAADSVGQKVSEAANRATEAAKEVVGDAEEPRSVASARAEFEASRSEETKAEANKDRKSQLTDKAVGDNPADQRTRDEHEILPNQFYEKY